MCTYLCGAFRDPRGNVDADSIGPHVREASPTLGFGVGLAGENVVGWG